MEINKLLKELATLTGYELKKKTKENLRNFIDPLVEDKYKDTSVEVVMDRLDKINKTITKMEEENREIKNKVATHLNENVNKSNMVKRFMASPRVRERLIIEDKVLADKRLERNELQRILDQKETENILNNLNITNIISTKLDRKLQDDIIVIKKSYQNPLDTL